ncbi:LamG domain-containing protein [Panacibacter ginsenosidivorans]|uniref:LamG domain-containing protein n=1 Tax=Panacibacter ginsenosidivorans TaxID=1813871 RepID=A0A5B8V3K4_9BACT|nr:LamG domain-containing protein [Panacibacter ginsenosidivorans]QEC65954.1 LamG domain-containing protein [Panacibacter ginsenosidivorans]
MKNLLVWISFTLFFYSCKKDNSSVPEIPVSNIHLDNGLLAYYPFNGNSNDESGNNNNGIISGGAISYDEHGNENSAYNCTSNGNKIIVNNTNGSIYFDTAFSVSLNVMIRALGRQCFLSIVNNSNGKAPAFVVGTNLPGNYNLNFAIPYGSNPCDGYSTDETTINNTSSIQLQPESWYNVICIFSNGVSKVYLNGDLVATKTGSENAGHVCPDTQLLIGSWWNGDPISLNGRIDEIRIYNRSLNFEEIDELSKDFQ